MKCSLTVCSSTEGKEKELAIVLYMGKTSSLSGKYQGKSEKKKKERKGELDQDEDAAKGAWTISSR